VERDVAVRRGKILIADDDKQLVAALSVRLQAHGYDVLTSVDSYNALALARTHKPDILILDIHMPAGEGFSVQQRMQKIEELEGTPVIYITADASKQLETIARRLGACALFRKPFDFYQLLHTIERQLDRCKADL